MSSVEDAEAVDIGRWHSAPRTRSVRIGRLRATYVEDGIIQAAPSLLWPDRELSYWDAHPEHLDSGGLLVMGVGGLLVEGDGWTILIDSGLGPIDLSGSATGVGAVHGGALMSTLARLGTRPAELSAVAITHLHLDHVGWWHNGTGETEPSPFSGIRAVMTAEEWSHAGSSNATPGPSSDVVDELTPGHIAAAPVQALKPTAQLLADGDEVAPGVAVHLAPGHTPGHAVFGLTSGDTTMVAFGDAFHSPVQVANPRWIDATDHDPQGAVNTRLRLLETLNEPNTFAFGIHFSDVVFGRVVRTGANSRWQPIETELR